MYNVLAVYYTYNAFHMENSSMWNRTKIIAQICLFYTVLNEFRN